MSVPYQYPMRFFGIGVTCNNRIALIVDLSGWFLQVVERETIPFYLFLREDGDYRTRDLTGHNLTFFLWRHGEEVNQKCYVTNAARVVAF